MNLTNEEIKALIRKSQGWTELKEGPRQYGWKRGNKWHYLHDVPNYPLDLNACAEFEKTLTDEEWEAYADHLLWDEGETGHSNYSACKTGCIATARQRCLAFLKTKGLIP